MPYVPPHKRQRANKKPTQKVDTNRHEYRYKSIVIPYIETTYNSKTYKSYVLVEDAKFNELTFVIGGCKMREIPKNVDSTFFRDYGSYTTCALRELKEETRDVFGNVSKYVLEPGFKFSSKDRSKAELAKDRSNGVVVTMRYTVHFLRLDMTKAAFNDVKKRFKSVKPKNPENNETSDIVLMTKSELQKAKMWSFMKERVLPKLTD